MGEWGRALVLPRTLMAVSSPSSTPGRPPPGGIFGELAPISTLQRTAEQKLTEDAAYARCRDATAHQHATQHRQAGPQAPQQTPRRVPPNAKARAA
jgi:hypothetical protein